MIDIDAHADEHIVSLLCDRNECCFFEYDLKFFCVVHFAHSRFFHSFKIINCLFDANIRKNRIEAT